MEKKIIYERQLNEEIEKKIEHFSRVEHGTEESKRAREDLVPLIDRSIEMEKLRLEREEREERRRIDEEDKKRTYAAQIERNNLEEKSRTKDRIVRILEFGSAFALSAFFGYWVPKWEKKEGEIFDDDSSRTAVKNGLNCLFDTTKRRR